VHGVEIANLETGRLMSLGGALAGAAVNHRGMPPNNSTFPPIKRRTAANRIQFSRAFTGYASLSVRRGLNQPSGASFIGCLPRKAKRR